MKEEKTNTKKRTLYYFLLFVSVLLLAAATVLTVYFTTRREGELADTPAIEDPDDTDKPEDPGDVDEPGGPDEPTGGEEVLYVAPVAAEDYSVEFDAVYANKVTGSYYRHQGVDLVAAAGSDVFAIADGTVTDVSLSEALGNLISIDHGDGLVCVYRFVEPVEGLKEGDKVSRGDKIATVAEAYGTEAGDGTHLHFETILNGEQTDPAQYLDPVYSEK